METLAAKINKKEEIKKEIRNIEIKLMYYPSNKVKSHHNKSQSI